MFARREGKSRRRWPRPAGLMAGLAAGLMADFVAVGLSMSLLVAGCSALRGLQSYRGEERVFRHIAERMSVTGKVEGMGTIRIEYRGQTMDLPFAMKLGANGLLEIESDVVSRFWPGFGRISIVSDQNDTAVYSAGRRVDPAAYDTVGPVLRPVLLSIFGGGEMLVRWLALNGCKPGYRSVCKGLEIGVNLNRERDGVERWTVRDPVGKASFNGFAEPRSGNGMGAWITGGMLHPSEIGITVRYSSLGAAVGTM